MIAFVMLLVCAMLASGFRARLWEFDEEWEERRQWLFATFLFAFVALGPLAVALRYFMERRR